MKIKEENNYGFLRGLTQLSLVLCSECGKETLPTTFFGFPLCVTCLSKVAYRK